LDKDDGKSSLQELPIDILKELAEHSIYGSDEEGEHSESKVMSYVADYYTSTTYDVTNTIDSERTDKSDHSSFLQRTKKPGSHLPRDTTSE